MANIENYYNPSFMQIYINKNENEFFSKDPQITFFKKTYIAPEIFIKDEISLKSIPMKWDDTTFMKIPKDIHLLGKIWLTVNIPYFQLVQNVITNTTTTTNNANVNEMIFDNYLTYLIIYNDIYYLIPLIFLQLPDLHYNYFKLKFGDVSKYFISLAGLNINTNTDIIFFSFNMNVNEDTIDGYKYSHDIIPVLLNLSSTYDKLTLDKLINGKDRYKVNLLTQNSFDKYITKTIEDNIINQYQNISKFDSTIDSSYYNFMALEFDVLYNNNPSTVADTYLIEEYINTNNINTVDEIDTIKQNTITKTSLVLEYIITDLNPSFEKTYTFYKKYAVIKNDSLYNITLTDANLTSGTIIGDYPIYTVNITSLNLPFTLNTNMIFKTAINS
jgi:hypothetical protein